MANAQPSYRAYTVTKREGQVRDNDGVYGPVFTRRVRAMGSGTDQYRPGRRGRTHMLNG
jgi:hypothetical protein